MAPQAAVSVANTNTRSRLTVFLHTGLTRQEIGTTYDRAKLLEHSPVAYRSLRHPKTPRGAVVFTSTDDDHLNPAGLKAVLGWIEARPANDTAPMTIMTIKQANPGNTIADTWANKITFLAITRSIGMHSVLFGNDMRDSVQQYINTHKLTDSEYRRVLTVLKHDKPLVDKVFIKYGQLFADQPKELQAFVEWCDAHGYEHKTAKAKRTIAEAQKAEVAQAQRDAQREALN